MPVGKGTEREGGPEKKKPGALGKISWEEKLSKLGPNSKEKRSVAGRTGIHTTE